MNVLDLATLKRDIPEHKLSAGDIGTVVHVHGTGKSYEVEFVNAGGRTLALLTLASTDIRPMDAGEILHARALSVG